MIESMEYNIRQCPEKCNVIVIRKTIITRKKNFERNSTGNRGESGLLYGDRGYVCMYDKDKVA